MSSFKHLRAVVTGSSSGIGRRIATELARRASGDSRIVIHCRGNLEGAEETAFDLRELGVATEVVAADLTKESAIARLVDRAWDFLEVPNVWVNNAGADVLTGDAVEESFSRKLRRLLEVDVVGTIELSRRVVNRLMEAELSPPPSLTFIGWDQAPHGMDGDAGQMFGPVKAAVMAYANSLAQEVAPHIRVNTVAPGWIRTAWGESTNDYWDRRAKDEALMGRWGTPEDVAAAVCFVADRQNTFCTGQTITVNGGWSRKYGES